MEKTIWKQVKQYREKNAGTFQSLQTFYYSTAFFPNLRIILCLSLIHTAAPLLCCYIWDATASDGKV